MEMQGICKSFACMSSSFSDGITKVCQPFCASLIDYARDCFTFLRKFNPYSSFLDSLQEWRGQAKVKEAPKTLYQKSCSRQQDSSRPQVFIFMGNGQNFNDKEEESGMLKLYKKLKEANNCDVIICHGPSASADLKHRYGLSFDHSLNPQIIEKQVKNLIYDRMHSRGDFAGLSRPSEVITVGYSWGGGLQHKILEDWDNLGAGVKVSLSASVDAIQYGSENLGSGLRQRSQTSRQHANFYQQNDYFLNGGSISSKPDDESLLIQDSNHRSIDDNPRVLDKIYNKIQEEIKTIEAT